MNRNIKSFVIAAIALLVGASASFVLLRTTEQEADTDTKTVSVVKSSRRNRVRKVTEIKLLKKNGKSAVRIVESEMAPPRIGVSTTESDIDEENLTQEQKRILAELQEALDSEDLKKVRKVLAKFLAKAEKGGLGGKVPVCMRARAVEALGWFGKAAAIDLLGFMADANDEVAADAFSQFELALSDVDMGDLERSQILKAAMSALTDKDQIDSLLAQINDMRNSRKVETILAILEKGTEQAKQVLREQLGDYLDSEVVTESDIHKWQAENPDDENDEEFYGGTKNN